MEERRAPRSHELDVLCLDGLCLEQRDGKNGRSLKLLGWVMEDGIGLDSGLPIRKDLGDELWDAAFYYEMHTLHLPQQPHDPFPHLIYPLAVVLASLSLTF